MTVCYWCGSKDTLADVGKELDDGKYKMVQCSKCKNAYYVVNKEKMNKPKPMTNEEWLRSATTEQLVIFIAKQKCDGCNDKPYDEKHGTCMYCMAKKTEQVREWLKQPHTVKE